MGKHSKKAGVMGSEALTYHERRALGFGTRKERFGKETMGNYDDCVLTLQPAIVRGMYINVVVPSTWLPTMPTPTTGSCVHTTWVFVQ